MYIYSCVYISNAQAGVGKFDPVQVRETKGQQN
jgi:hypothetical protein